MDLRQWALGASLGLLALAAFVLGAPPASAAVTIDGDWVISGSETYVNEAITVLANGSTGNIFVMPGADLHLENTTVVFPGNRTFDHQGTLEVRNSTIRSPAWFFWIRGAAELHNVELSNVSYDRSGGLSGTVVTNASVTFDNVRWNRTVCFMCDWFVHMRVAVNFSGNYIGYRGQLSYELPSLSRSLTIEISRNRFMLDDGGFTRTTAIDIANALHTGTVTFDIHDNVFSNGDDGIAFGSSSPSTTYLIYDSTFTGIGNTAIEIGQGERFGGVVRVWNVTIASSMRAARILGAAGSSVNGTMDSVTVTGCEEGIVANGAGWIVRNSSFASTSPMYQAETNGHIYIFDTADTAFDAAVPGSGGSVEHFAFLNIVSMTWQGLLPIVGDLVSLRNATGLLNFQLDPQSWAAQTIVWWGMYNGAPRVDNRDLRPTIEDGPRSFGCSPAQFFVTVPMPAVSLTCTDDAAPSVAVAAPAPNTLQNSSTLLAAGTVAEYGAGLNTLDWSFDNASWGPVTMTPPGSANWSLYIAGLVDGNYTLYLRAADRAGLVGYAARGVTRVDVTAPTLDIPSLPSFASGLFLNLTGTTEGLATVSFLTAGGSSAAVGAAANGSFALPTIRLVEGVNLIWITAEDLAHNKFVREVWITVDSVPPSLAVYTSPTSSTNEGFITVAGLSEPNATVRVNGQPTIRNGGEFTIALALSSGLNSITVSATDVAGNTALWFGIAWSDDDVPVIDASISTGNFTADGVPITRVGAVPLSGTVTDATSPVVSLTVNSVPYTFDGAGGFFISLSVIDGENTFVVNATDSVGNVATRTLRVLRDSTAPVADAQLEPADAALTNLGGLNYTKGNFVLVALSLSEEGVATVHAETRAVAAGRNVFNVSVSEGANTISVSFRDRAGNAGKPFSLGVVRDTTSPTLSISSPSNGSSLPDEIAIVIGVTEPGATVLVNGVQVTVTQGGFTTSAPLASGANTITVVAIDPLGNSNATSVTVTRRPQAVTGGDAGASSGILMLGLGAAIGLALGFVVRGRMRRSDDLPPPDVVGAAGQAEAPAARPAAARGPKGPRGPQGPLP